MWVLPTISSILGAVSLAMFIYALRAPSIRAQARLDTAMSGVEPVQQTVFPEQAMPWASPDRAASISALMERLPWVDVLQLQLLRAGWIVRPSEFIAFSSLGALAAAGGLALLTHSNLMALPGLLAPYGAAWLWLKARQSTRNRALNAQLPDMLDMMSSSLRAGFSAGQALNRVHAQMLPPVADEVGRTLEEIRFGRSLATALEAMVARTGSYDVALVVSAIQTQLETGGNMSEVLDKIAAMIRERVWLKGEITIAASEGRLSAIVLVILPIAMTLLIQTLNPSYLKPLFATSTGHIMLGIAILLMLVGSWSLHRLTSIEV